MRPPILLWAVPRSVSTAFERAMRARGDLTVFSEPFSAPYYLSEERVSGRYGEPARGNSTHAWAGVVEELTAAARLGTVFVKDMAYHVAPCLGPELVASFQNTFIVRHPGRTLASLVRLFPDFTPEEAGFERQYELMRLAADASPDGDLVVIDGDELRRSPRGVVEDYCRRVGIAFRPESLSWEPGLLAEWGPWKEWHDDAAASTGIRPPDEERDVEPPAGIDPAVYATCLDLYERMVELGRERGRA